MPFGLASDSFVFQRVIESLFKDLEGIAIFQDDVLIYGTSVIDHDSRLHHVLKVFKEKGITLGAEKCKFNVQSINYLGHKISPNGIQPKKNLIDCIGKFPSPINKEQLRSFMGMVEFYA